MKVEPAGSLVGHLGVPGDKSISHRAVLIGALGEGETRVQGFGRSADTESTIAAVRTLGVEVDEPAEDELVVRGVGLRGLQEANVYCGNAGTLMRLLAGLNADSTTTVIEPVPTRDHTELMLAAAGARVRRRPSSVSIEPAARLELGEVTVPGDFSSAAPFLVAATLLSGSELTIHDVGLNPRRIGLLEVLERMGARISVLNRRKVAGEWIGDLEVQSAELVATDVGADEVPRLVDELPLYALAAAGARGDSHLTGAAELRVKETDRIETVTNGLRALGIRIRARNDGFEVRGVPARPTGGRMSSNGDHRIAVLAAIAGLVSREGVDVGDADAVAISFPGFFDILDSVSRR